MILYTYCYCFSNSKYLKREYEQFVLTIGDFDECVFLNETASEELGTSEFRSSSSELDDSLVSRNPAVMNRIHHDQPNNFIHMTPLSSQNYLATRTPVNKSITLTPITSATASISRLHSILIGHNNEPSVDLTNLFLRCKNNPKERIEKMVKDMGDIFLAAFSKENASQSVIRKTSEIQYIVTDQFPKNRLNLAVKFFYNVLEKILKGELRRNQRLPESHLSETLARVIDRDVFQRSLFACSLEIILHSYSPSNRVFPWILDIFNEHEDLKIHSFYFYKVVEPIIRDEQGLSREIVKHLNAIEEKILSSLAWKADSPLWDLFKQNCGSAPSCREVSKESSSILKALEYSALQNELAGNNPAKRQLTFNNGNGQDDVLTKGLFAWTIH